MPVPTRREIVPLFGVLLLCGCDVLQSIPASGGVCDSIQKFGETVEKVSPDGGHVCRTKVDGIALTVFSKAGAPGVPSEVRLDGRYSRTGDSNGMKRRVLSVSEELFTGLDMAVPPGIAIAIQTQSRSEATQGRLRVVVDHACDSTDLCVISMVVQASERKRL